MGFFEDDRIRSKNKHLKPKIRDVFEVFTQNNRHFNNALCHAVINQYHHISPYPDAKNDGQCVELLKYVIDGLINQNEYLTKQVTKYHLLYGPLEDDQNK